MRKPIPIPGASSLSSLALLVLLGIATAIPARAQGVPLESAQVEAWALAQRTSQRAHLWRVSAWGLANAVGGLALWAGTRNGSEVWRGYGLQSSLWGVINLGIGTAGLLGGSYPDPADLGAVLAAERSYHDIVLLNMGLNVGYMAVGTALVAAAHYGVRNASTWRGHGAAVIVQGVGLFVLDGVTLLRSRGRLGDMLDALTSVAIQASPVAPDVWTVGVALTF